MKGGSTAIPIKGGYTMTTQKMIRLASERDSAALLDIYTPFVRDTSVSFEYDVPGVEEFADRIRTVTAKFPWLVCEIDGRVIGYAYASKHRERSAYQWSVDVSVYVDPEYHRRHVATALYTALIDILKLQGFYNAYAGIAMPNEKSEGFHEFFGFKKIGVYHHVGYKLGEWHDVKWFELTLAEVSNTPVATKTINEIKDTKEFTKIIENALKLLDGINSVSIRDYLQEDLEYIIDRHAEIYGTEYGFRPGFRNYVEKYILAFNESHDINKENIWIAESNKRPVGSIAIVKADDTKAQLRWFLVESGMRGKGLGRMLIETAIDFCRKNKYKHIFLWTVSLLDAARHLYRDYGFIVTETKKNDDWADGLTEECWELSLE